MTVTSASCTRLAVADPPEVSAANPIHDESAVSYGYAGGIVAGIHTYGWMVPAFSILSVMHGSHTGGASFVYLDLCTRVMNFSPK